MFVGHALLAFALVGGAVGLLRDRRTGLQLGLVAGAFAAVPDVDMSYALVGLLGVDGGAFAAASAFWAASTLVHRAVTHSILVAPVVATLAGVWVYSRRRPNRIAPGLGAVLAASLVVVATLSSGALGGAVMAVFLFAAVAAAEVVVRASQLSATTTFGAALVGLVSHPFGDMVTGHPPALLYPLEATVVTERVALHADPTLHLLGAFAVELGAIWAGVFTLCWLLERPVRPMLNLRPVVGAGYAAAALVIPAPTLDLSYPFVFSVLAVGTVGAVPRFRLPRRVELPNAADAAVTGLTAVTVAAVAYTVAYLVVL